MSAPGPTGDRQEQLDDILRSCGPAVTRRLVRALDELTVRQAAGTLAEARRWLLNTQLLFLRKDVESKNKDFDDEQWTLEDHPWDVDIPEAEMMTQEEADAAMNEEDKGVPGQAVKDVGGKG